MAWPGPIERGGETVCRPPQERSRPGIGPPRVPRSSVTPCHSMPNESAPAKPSQEVPVCVPGQQPRQADAPPRSAGEALAALDAALGYLANTNAAALTTIE